MPRRFLGYAAAVAGVALANALFWATRGALESAHASLLYLVVVVLVAYAAGSGPAVVSALLSFLSWNYFFILPTGTFYVHQPRDLIALMVFLIVAVLTGELAGRAREQAVAAQERERETSLLYGIGMASSGEADPDAVLPRVLEQAVSAAQVRGAAVVRPGPEGELQVAAIHPPADLDAADPAWRDRAADVIRTGAPAGWEAPDGEHPIYLPLTAGPRIVGAMIVAPGPRFLPWRSRRFLLAAAGHAAIALERQRLSAEAAQAEVLRAAEQFRGTLLSSVSHDLRTPLASIKAAATSLLHAEAEHSPATRRELLEAIDEEADRLNAFVGALLDISRLEAGAWRPEREWFDLTEVVGTVLNRLDEASAARVHVRIPADLPLVPVDCVQFGQALWNLLENALKFSPAGSPVEIEASIQEPEMLRLTVSDHGPGVPPGEEERIFEKFYRASGDRKRRGVPGTGLGLAIARGIVEAHGGHIRAMSRAAAVSGGEGRVERAGAPAAAVAGGEGRVERAGAPATAVSGGEGRVERAGGGATFEILLPLRAPEMPLPSEYEEERVGEEGEEHGR